jgi:hypothetical protein
MRIGFSDYRAIMHAHAEDASHTGGTRTELLAAAKRAGVNVVMLTDHVRPERDFIKDSWRGLREGVLFVPGAEDRGFLVFPMESIKTARVESRDEYVALVRRHGGNIFLSHVEDRPDWPTNRLDGLEIYNHHSDIKDEAGFMLWLQGALTDPIRLPKLVDALERYPAEVFGAQQDYLSAIIAKWDRDTLVHRSTAVAANDCHHNQVFTVTAVDEKTVELGFITSKPTTSRVSADQVPGVAGLTKDRRAGELIARLDFDPYERSLRYVTTHLLLPGELTESAVRDALSSGHAYVAHDWLCDPTGFVFVATGGSESPKTAASQSKGDASKSYEARPARTAVSPAGGAWIMGDVVRFTSKLLLRATTPVSATIKLIRNGEVVRIVQAGDFEFAVESPGVYRIEAWLTLDGEQRPWIYSNPIYVR